MKGIKILLLFALSANMIIGCQEQEVQEEQKDDDFRHVIAAIEEGKFLGWPANNGFWQWGDEILVGFTRGEHAERGGHNITGIEESLFSRSRDGGETWEMFKPADFMDDDNIKWSPEEKKRLETPLNFEHEGFAMRLFGTGYHGNDDPEGGFYYSYDRGATWEGPWYLGEMHKHEEFRDHKITARTDYIVTGEQEMYLFVSARNENVQRLACIKTTDGGKSFEFVSWITPAEYDVYVNTAMSSTVRVSDDTFVTAYRKIYPALDNREGNGVEVAVSRDRGYTWKVMSNVKYFQSSSNPPALLNLPDGRLLCVYGDRHNSRLSGKYSKDGGKTWGEEFIIRDNFDDGTSYWDFGYPVILQRDDGTLLSIYYWASGQNQQQHIAVSMFEPPEFDPEEL